VTISDFAVLDLDSAVQPDPDELVRAAMKWHFSPETGTPFWLDRAPSLGFDPVGDIKTYADLTMFPNVTDELREVPVERLIPRGYGPHPAVAAVIESGGTTGAPKRIPLLQEYADFMVRLTVSGLVRSGVSQDENWLTAMPSGPHGAFDHDRRSGAAFGVRVFAIDMDPRWVKREIASGHATDADRYVDHLVDQARYVLRGQNVGTIRLTPPLLARVVRDDEMVELIQQKIHHINWGGAHMDADSRYFYRTELFPGAKLSGGYGTTMALGGVCNERAGLLPADPCVYDPSYAPYSTMQVVNAETGQPVGHGERGQLVVTHVSKCFLLPNNFERDTATRVAPQGDQVGDSVADIWPLATFGGTEVIEGVY
jgi:hypothetical protein